MSPELKDLLTDAARDPRRSVDVDDIHRRGRRSRVIQTAGTIAVVALVLGGAAVGVDRLGSRGLDAPIVGSPDGSTPTDQPTATDPTALRTISAADMGVDVLLSVDAEEGDGHVLVLGADGSIDRLGIDAAAPSYARMVPDGEGGFSWQPVSGAGGSPPILHVGRDGRTATVVPATTDPSDTYRLVGGTGYSLLVEHRYGEGFDTTADLLEWWAGGTNGEPTILHEGVGGWEAGVTSAANLETTLYAATDAGWAGLIVAPPDRDAVTIWEGGEAKAGEFPVGVAVAGGQGYALIDRAEGDLLFVIQLFEELPRVSDGWPVPLHSGDVEGDAIGRGGGVRDEPDVRPAGLSALGNYVLVNRQLEDRWLAPMVYETTSGRWSVLDREGRALLASPAPQEREPAACAADDDLRNAPPGDGTEMWLYATCTSDVEPWIVYRLPSGSTRSGDVVADARQALDLMIAGVPSGQANRGYYASTPPGLAVRDVSFADGTLVVDFDFSGITMWAFTTTYGSTVWHAGLLANLLQLPEVEVVELRESGSCEKYPGYFESEGCFRFRADEDAPWLDGRAFG